VICTKTTVAKSEGIGYSFPAPTICMFSSNHCPILFRPRLSGWSSKTDSTPSTGKYLSGASSCALAFLMRPMLPRIIDARLVGSSLSTVDNNITTQQDRVFHGRCHFYLLKHTYRSVAPKSTINRVIEYSMLRDAISFTDFLTLLYALTSSEGSRTTLRNYSSKSNITIEIIVSLWRRFECPRKRLTVLII
jgi:hypothetical protein